MTLHEAIYEILLLRDEPLTSNELVEIINNQKLYRRKDGAAVTSTQIMARVNRYLNAFKVESNKISIIDKEIIVYKDEYYRIFNELKESKLLLSEIKPIAILALFVGWRGKSDYLQSIDDRELLKNKILDSVNFLDNENSQFLIEIIDRLSERDCTFVLRVIDRFKSFRKPSKSIFASFFNDLVNEFSNSNGLYYGEHSSPRILNYFLSSIFEVPNNGVLFDPFAGNASSLVSIYRRNKNINFEIFANDIAAPARIFGALNLFVNGYENLNFSDRDFLNTRFQGGFADLVVTVPPFGIRSKRNFHVLTSEFLEFIGPDFSNGEYLDSQVLTILSIIFALKDKGKAVLVVPDIILFSGKRDFVLAREFLIKKNILRGIISLPNSIFRPYNVNISSSVIILENSKSIKVHNLFLFDGSRYNNDDFEKNIQNIIQAYRGHIEISNGILINANHIPFENYDLSPRRYLLESLTDSDHVTISSLTESISTGIVISKHNINKSGGIPFIQVGDLNDSPGLNEVDISKAEYFITDDELISKNPRFIPENAVLIAKVGSKLKPSLFKGGRALCNPNIIVIKTDENYLLPEYLVTQLQSEYVIRQIDAIKHNIGVPHFSKQDFVHVKIKILSIGEQRKYTASFYGKQLEEVKLITDREREEDLYNIIASLKHELKQPISSLGLDLDSLFDFLKNKINTGEKLSWDESIVKLLPGQSKDDMKDFTLKNVLSRMSSGITDAQNTLSKTEEILNVGAGVFMPERLMLKKFLTTVIKPMFVNGNCTINIVGDEREMVVDKYQIEVLFKRLIENAIKHGFSKSEDKTKNIVNVRLAGKNAYKDFNEIIVENNGQPFPAEFDILKFEKVGQTANRYRGTGFGGFHIKRIIESHKGEFYIADKEEVGESQFKVKFKIYLP